MAVVTTRQLLDSGVHFGHQTRRWNPKMKKFIFTERNGIYIIDLQQSLTYIDTAYGFVKDLVARGGQILFVGTKKQAQESIAEQATRVGMPFVNQRWLGGMLTNFATISKRIAKMKELEGLNFDDVAASGMTKKELLQQKRKKDKLAKTLSGIRDMGRLPQAIWVVDTKKEHLAIDEARKLNIPIVGILDTNCDPDEVDYAIPGNDDAIRSVGLLTRVIADAVADGLLARSQVAASDEEAEPMPDWERALLAGAEGEPAEQARETAVREEAKAKKEEIREEAKAVAEQVAADVAEIARDVAIEETEKAAAKPAKDKAAEAKPAAAEEPAKEEPKAKAEPKAKEKAAAEPAAEAKEDAKPEPKAEPKAEKKPEPKDEPKAEAKAEPKAEPKADKKPAAKDEPKAEAVDEPKTKAHKAEDKPEKAAKADDDEKKD
jgi:small subunit ribosomal protein S2